MSGHDERIERLRRRVAHDPASVAFAGLAEEYRKAGRYAEAIQTCSAGLEEHPSYLSARVTLARCLVAAEDLDGARAELEQVLEFAPQNLVALRELADLHRRQHELDLALDRYRTIQMLVGPEPELDAVVASVERALEERPPVEASPGPRGPDNPSPGSPAGATPGESGPGLPPPGPIQATASRTHPAVPRLERLLEAIARRRAQLGSRSIAS